MNPWAQIFALALALALGVPAVAMPAGSVRIKDVVRIQGDRDFTLVGYGVVTGLAGTGDSLGNQATRQSISNLLSQFNLSLPADSITSRNVAAVMVSASIPTYARPGDKLDITVTSLGDARSLVGGNLVTTPLKGPDGQIYALADGALTVGGYKYDANGNVVQKNHPTAATVPSGATVEISPPAAAAPADAGSLSLLLASADYTTASRIADAINREMGVQLATATDAEGIRVLIPQNYANQRVEFIRRIEKLEVAPDERARVVINERTGTVVAGADVKVSPVVVSYGDLKISVVSENSVSQPIFIGRPSGGISSVPYTNTSVDAAEQVGNTVTTSPGGTVADLVQALTRLRINTRDIVSIFKALKASGALHADLIVQ